MPEPSSPALAHPSETRFQAADDAAEDATERRITGTIKSGDRHILEINQTNRLNLQTTDLPACSEARRAISVV
jgi:hypothetical protein